LIVGLLEYCNEGATCVLSALLVTPDRFPRSRSKAGIHAVLAEQLTRPGSLQTLPEHELYS